MEDVLDPEDAVHPAVSGSLIHSTAPAATGCAYQTADGEFNVEAVVQPEPSAEETLDQRMEKEMELLGQTVTYKKKGETWFVLSGVTSDGTEYYRKLFTNGAQWVTLRITYPHVRNKKYDKWVTRMEKTFVPFEKAAAMRVNLRSQHRRRSRRKKRVISLDCARREQRLDRLFERGDPRDHHAA